MTDCQENKSIMETFSFSFSRLWSWYLLYLCLLWMMSSPTTDSKPQRININQDIYVVIETGHMYSVFISKHCLKKRGTVPLKIKRLPLCFVFDAKHTWRRKRFKICSGFTPQLKGVWWYCGSVGTNSVFTNILKSDDYLLDIFDSVSCTGGNAPPIITPGYQY